MWIGTNLTTGILPYFTRILLVLVSICLAILFPGWADVHGRKSRGRTRTSTPEFGVGVLMQIVPQILSRFKFQTPDCLCYNALKCLPTPLFQQSIHYFPKVHLQRPPNHHFRRKIHFSGKDTDEQCLSECTKTCHFIAPSPDPYPLVNRYFLPIFHPSPLPSLDPPCIPREFQPHLHHCRYLKRKPFLLEVHTDNRSKLFLSPNQHCQSTVDFRAYFTTYFTILNKIFVEMQRTIVDLIQFN